MVLPFALTLLQINVPGHVKKKHCFFKSSLCGLSANVRVEALHSKGRIRQSMFSLALQMIGAPISIRVFLFVCLFCQQEVHGCCKEQSLQEVHIFLKALLRREKERVR